MLTIRHEHARSKAAKVANEEDAFLWRWFSGLYEEGRIRWCRAPQGWLVSIDRKHLSTEADFDMAIRSAKERYFSGRRAAENPR